MDQFGDQTDLPSHGRGRGFESLIAHREKPLLSGGFFASVGRVIGGPYLQNGAEMARFSE